MSAGVFSLQLSTNPYASRGDGRRRDIPRAPYADWDHTRIGIRGELGLVSWDLAIYRSWMRNELLGLNNNQGVPLGTVNAPKTIHQGVEWQLEVELAHSLLVRNGDTKKTDRIVLQQSYTLNDFHFRNNVYYRNNQIAGIPSQFYKGELRYEHPCGFYFATNVEWNIVKYPVDEANTLFADPYALLGVRQVTRLRRASKYSSRQEFDEQDLCCNGRAYRRCADRPRSQFIQSRERSRLLRWSLPGLVST